MCFHADFVYFFFILCWHCALFCFVLFCLIFIVLGRNFIDIFLVVVVFFRLFYFLVLIYSYKVSYANIKIFFYIFFYKIYGFVWWWSFKFVVHFRFTWNCVNFHALYFNVYFRCIKVKKTKRLQLTKSSWYSPHVTKFHINLPKNFSRNKKIVRCGWRHPVRTRCDDNVTDFRCRLTLWLISSAATLKAKQLRHFREKCYEDQNDFLFTVYIDTLRVRINKVPLCVGIRLPVINVSMCLDENRNRNMNFRQYIPV